MEPPIASVTHTATEQRLGTIPGLTKQYLLFHNVCPLEVDGTGTLTVAVGPSPSASGLEDLAIAYRAELREQPVSEAELVSLIERATWAGGSRIELARENDSVSDGLDADVRDLALQPPVVRYVNLLIRDAYEVGASDVHLEATRSGLLVRYRLDGVLIPASDPPLEFQQAVVSRIKLLAELDISERRRPQDGRIRVRLEERELDLRVSTIPTMHGESVVLRLLERSGRAVGLDELGLEPDALSSFSSLVVKPHGLVLVTGPTGSGKTTTLYAALGQRDVRAEKIITVEDPIEYHLFGVTQMPVHRQAGVTFASALRSILRQDPDVIMVGEMRDQETAELAIQAAMTGHMVLATLHTNDALGAVPRLRDLGIPDYLLAATLSGVLAQRLVRRICDGCRRPDGARGSGCAICRGTGFRGRVGIFELVLINDEMRTRIARGAGRQELKMLHGDGTPTLRDDGLVKCRRGLTTIDEVLRVVQD